MTEDGTGEIRISHDPISVTSAVQQAPSVDSEEMRNLKGQERLIARAMLQYRSVVRSERRLRQDMIEARRFRLGVVGNKHYQWPEHIVAEREAERRPVVTVNRCAGFVDMARNMGDAANLLIQVKPVDDHSDPKTAAILAGLIRNVEVNSVAEDVYSTAGDAQCEMGRGYFWVRTSYCDDKSWKMKASLHRIIDPFRVKVDSSAAEKDQSDAEFAFYDTDIDIATWDAVYGDGGKKARPEKTMLAWAEGSPGVDESLDWFPSDEKVSIKHWFCAEYTPSTLYEMKNGPDLNEKELEDAVLAQAEQEDQMLMATGSPLTVDRAKGWEKTAKDAFLKQFGTGRSRPLKLRRMVWRVIDAQYVHSETTWPTPWQPFIPMIGNESAIDGETELRGVTQDVMGSQKVYNVHVSALAESVNDFPKAPFVGYRGVFGAENTAMRKSWATAGSKKHAFLETEPIMLPDGRVAPPPQRQFAEAQGLQSMNLAIRQAENDMKATARWHDASLGESGPQESGRAITSRQRQDEMSQSHYTRNRRIAITSGGKQLIRIFREIYDVAQVVRITGDDGKKRAIMVYAGKDNDPRQDPNFQMPEGVKEIFDIGTGEYDVEVTAAPSPGSRRQEDIDIVTEVMKMMPPGYAVNMMDLLLQLLDTPVGRRMADRANKMLPPGLRDDGDENTPEIPPQVIQQMQEMKERERAMMMKLSEQERIIETKRLDYAGKKEIAAMEMYVDLAKLITTEESADRRLLLKAEIERINTFLQQATAQAQAADAQAAAASAPVAPGRPSPVSAAPELG